MSDERCWLCDDPTGNAGRGEGSLYDKNDLGPYCEKCWDNEAAMAEEIAKEEA